MDPSSTQTVDQWFSLAYEELRRLAAVVRQREQHGTLNPTALVHEAYVRLSAAHGLSLESRAHFLATAARAMRRVLVDAARRQQAEKRGRSPDFVTLDENSGAASQASPEATLALDDALEELERHDPRASQVVQCRFFGGLTVTETARVLQLSEATVHREWQFARAWLLDALRRAG